MFMVDMLYLLSHVSWCCGGRMETCKKEIRRGEPVDQSVVRRSTVNYEVEDRGLNSQGLVVVRQHWRKE